MAAKLAQLQFIGYIFFSYLAKNPSTFLSLDRKLHILVSISDEWGTTSLTS